MGNIHLCMLYLSKQHYPLPTKQKTQYVFIRAANCLMLCTGTKCVYYERLTQVRWTMVEREVFEIIVLL